MKILICFPAAMELGGVERSLLGLLDALAKTEHEVSLFLYGHHGPLYHLLNKNIHLFPEIKELAYLQESLGTKIKNGALYSAFCRIESSLKNGRTADYFEYTSKVRARKAPKLEETYDIAVGFFLPFDFIKYNVNAKIKCGWVHTDYTKAQHNTEKLREQYSNLDYICTVSDDVKRNFVSIFPEFTDKTIVIENILSEDYLQKSAQESVEDFPDDGNIRLLSVGRFSEAKNFENVPEICKMIRESGLDVKWYLIGYGGYEKLIRQKIVEYRMQEYVIILGKKSNPYPYMANCDLYVQPSRFEGKAVTVREAQALGKPVVITNFPTAPSQFTNGFDGIIVSMDNRGCADGIISVLKNNDLQKELKKNCAHSDYSNQEGVKRIIQLTDKMELNRQSSD